MNTKDFELFCNLQEELEQKIAQIGRIMYHVFEETGLGQYVMYRAAVWGHIEDVDNDGVRCVYKDEDYNEYYSCFITKEWLSMSNEELSKMAERAISAAKQHIAGEKKRKDEAQYESDLKEFNRLKEKLGF